MARGDMKMRIQRKIAIALGAGIAGVGLFGAVAFAAFVPDGSVAGSVLGPLAPASSGDLKNDRLKSLLDGLVTKGVITQAQEDAIIAAVQGAPAARAKVEVLRDFLTTSAQYLGIADKDLRAKLAGTTLAAVASATPGKDRAGLVAAVNAAGNADIEKAIANKKITDDQAKQLRDGLPTRVNEFVDRKWPAKPAAVAPLANVKAFLGDLLQAGQSYLGVPLAEIRTQMAAGKSLGDIANSTPNKSRDGLVAALTTAANTRIDQAATQNKITVDQANTLKSKLTAEITSFVDRKMPVRAPKTTRPSTTAPKTTTPANPATASPSPKEDK
jgi:hypothetical protein